MLREAKKKKVAWGITGGGDKLTETFGVMKKLEDKYEERAEIWVYLSKAGEHVAKVYGILDDLKSKFDKILVEFSSNVPFLAGQLQAGKFEFLLVAPTTSNSVAKLAVGITDTMLCNAAIMGLKARVPVYVMPTDFRVGDVLTRLPDGRKLTLRTRAEDVDNVEKLRKMEGLAVINGPEKIGAIFEKYFGV